MQEWVDLYQRFWSPSKNSQSCIIRFKNARRSLIQVLTIFRVLLSQGPRYKPDFIPTDFWKLGQLHWHIIKICRFLVSLAKYGRYFLTKNSVQLSWLSYQTLTLWQVFMSWDPFLESLESSTLRWFEDRGFNSFATNMIILSVNGLFC